MDAQEPFWNHAGAQMEFRVEGRSGLPKALSPIVESPGSIAVHLLTDS